MNSLESGKRELSEMVLSSLSGLGKYHTDVKICQKWKNSKIYAINCPQILLEDKPFPLIYQGLSTTSKELFTETCLPISIYKFVLESAL